MVWVKVQPWEMNVSQLNVLPSDGNRTACVLTWHRRRLPRDLQAIWINSETSIKSGQTSRDFRCFIPWWACESCSDPHRVCVSYYNFLWANFLLVLLWYVWVHIELFRVTKTFSSPSQRVEKLLLTFIWSMCIRVSEAESKNVFVSECLFFSTWPCSWISVCVHICCVCVFVCVLISPGRGLGDQCSFELQGTGNLGIWPSLSGFSLGFLIRDSASPRFPVQCQQEFSQLRHLHSHSKKTQCHFTLNRVDLNPSNK